jgi:carbon storage regulator
MEEPKMLVLSRKQGEQLKIGDDVTISVIEVRGHRVRLGIQAPGSTRVMRAELCVWDDANTPARKPRREVALAG